MVILECQERNVALEMKRTFPNLQFCLRNGIYGLGEAMFYLLVIFPYGTEEEEPECGFSLHCGRAEQLYLMARL